MITHNIPLSILIRKSLVIIPHLQPGDFKGLENEVETAMVNKPSVVKPLKFFCNDNNVVIMTIVV